MIYVGTLSTLHISFCIIEGSHVYVLCTHFHLLLFIFKLQNFALSIVVVQIFMNDISNISNCHIQKECLSQHILGAQADLRSNNVLSDAVIHLDNGSYFPVHRIIMSAASEYFRLGAAVRLFNNINSFFFHHPELSLRLR